MPPRLTISAGDDDWDLVRPLFAAVYPPDVMAKVPWREVVWSATDRRVLVWRADELVAHVGITFRNGTLDGNAVRIGGIRGVATRPDLRGQGLATAAMRRAQAEIARCDFGLLFCEPHNFSFYENLAWQRFGGTVLVEQPAGTGPYTVVTPFVLDLIQAPRAGLLDLCGRPW